MQKLPAFLVGLLLCLCQPPVVATESLPGKILWAWQRQENLEQINIHEFGVAYFAVHMKLSAEKTETFWRDQALRVPKGCLMVPVLRIDTDRKMPPNFNDGQIDKIIQAIKQISMLPHTVEVQIDFDAVQSERVFYRKLIERIRNEVKLQVPLSITALASWCVFDNWISDLPVDEEVPMMFSLGGERKKILLYFRQGNDFRVPKCFRSLGISIDDPEVNQVMIPLIKRRKIPVHVFVFSRTAWNAKKIQSVRSLLRDL